MNNPLNWQASAVALFDKATTRLSDDVRQLQQTVSWLRPASPIAALRADAGWIQTRPDFKRSA
jgi:hypothetical protein